MNHSTMGIGDTTASLDMKLRVTRETLRIIRVRTGIRTGGGNGTTSGGATESALPNVLSVSC